MIFFFTSLLDFFENPKVEKEEKMLVVKQSFPFLVVLRFCFRVAHVCGFLKRNLPVIQKLLPILLLEWIFSKLSDFIRY